MAASVLYFNGRLTRRPGAYSRVDASALDVGSRGPTGIVAIAGMAVGGKPYTAVVDPNEDLQSARDTGRVRALFRSGDLRELAPIALDPSRDPEIEGGAQEVRFLKVNPAAASAAVFPNADGPALSLTSQDYGLFTTQISAEIADGTGGGKMVQVAFEDQLEVFDDLGADPKFHLQHPAGVTYPTTVAATVGPSGVQIAMTREDAGLDAEILSAGLTPGQAVQVVSAEAADVGILCTVYGLSTTDAPQSEVLTLNGATPVAGAATWNAITAVTLSGAATGAVTVSETGSIAVIGAGTTSLGLRAVDIPIAGEAVTVVADGATTQAVVLRGIGLNNATQAERIVLTGAAPVTSAASWKRISMIELGNIEVARDVTVAGAIVNATYAKYANLQQLRDLVASAGITFTALIGNLKDFPTSELDHVAGVDILSPATGSFSAVLHDLVEAINAQSQIVTAAREGGATGAPDNTAGAVYLAGGHEGDATPGSEGTPSATFADWQAALDLLRFARVNTLVIASTDDAVHAAASAHAEYCAGPGKSERDVIVGAAANETKAQLLARALALNSRHVRLCGEEILRFNSAGEREYLAPPAQAALLAGLQAAAPVGTPLTHKYLNVLGVRRHSGWNPLDDAEDLLAGGVLFTEHVPQRGYRVVRNITTALSAENDVFTEASANQALNHAVYLLRTRLEAAVGRKGFSGTVSATEGVATKILDDLLNEDKAITAWRSLRAELVGTALPVSVELAPVLPVNFVPISIHLART